MKKIIAALAVFLVAGLCVAGAALVASPGSLVVRPITPEAPCPVVGCASGACHGFDDVPGPDGVTEMTCPETGCSTTILWPLCCGHPPRAGQLAEAPRAKRPAAEFRAVSDDLCWMRVCCSP